MVEAEVIRTSASSLAATVVPIQAPNHWNLTALEPFIDLDVGLYVVNRLTAVDSLGK